MCNFFSLVSNGRGKYMYFNWELRKKCLSGELNYEPDSHTSIADYFGYKGKKEDSLNKYEYNPLTKVFTIDQINNKIDDSKKVEEFCRGLDFSKIVEPLIIKEIINPLKSKKAYKKDIKELKRWASVWAGVWAGVRDSVGASVWDSVWDSVWASVWDSVWASVWAGVRDSVWAGVRDSVGDSVWDSVGDSVWDSVWAGVGDSVRDSVGASVRAKISTFFNIKYDYDFESNFKLWERGLVPSFDGKIWRLHGLEGKILFEISDKDLKEYK